MKVGHVFGLDDIVEAHRLMEENRAEGKATMKESPSIRKPESTRNCPGCKGTGFYEVVPVGPLPCTDCGGTGKGPLATANASTQ